MKKTVFVLCLLSSAAALAQYSGGTSYISSEPVIYHAPSHPEHAAYAPMLREQSVLAGSSYNSAQGERPASDFPQPAEVSLGTAAREIRKQQGPTKKAPIVWVNQ